MLFCLLFVVAVVAVVVVAVVAVDLLWLWLLVLLFLVVVVGIFVADLMARRAVLSTTLACRRARSTPRKLNWRPATWTREALDAWCEAS